MNTTSKLHITKVEDHEGFGRCGQCERENLRWVVVLSDGTRVGTECAKRACGIVVKAATYQWMTEYEPVAEYADKFETAVVYQHRTSDRTRLVVNGYLQVNGGGMAEFARRYAT
jgi:hypothetical protein